MSAFWIGTWRCSSRGCSSPIWLRRPRSYFLAGQQSCPTACLHSRRRARHHSIRRARYRNGWSSRSVRCRYAPGQITLAPLVRASAALGEALAGDRPLGREDRTVLGTVSVIIAAVATFAWFPPDCGGVDGMGRGRVACCNDRNSRISSGPTRAGGGASGSAQTENRTRN